MKFKHKFLVIILATLIVFITLLSTAGEKPEELNEYNSIEIGLGLVLITSVFWAPLALALFLIPGKVK